MSDCTVERLMTLSSKRRLSAVLTKAKAIVYPFKAICSPAWEDRPLYILSNLHPKTGLQHKKD